MRFASTLAILSLFAAPLSILAAPAPAAAPVAHPEPHYGHHNGGGFKKEGFNGNHGSFTGSFRARPTDFEGQGQGPFSGGNGAQVTFVPNRAQASFVGGNGAQATVTPGGGRNGGNGAAQTTRVRAGGEATTTAEDVAGPTET
ncbi:MAG: hypothetical protein LQ350_001753 [Teloschistes chrysophthalmus]|nr:MAG: hypothetical protein LQ350_001753 [Niorma chrysophthalma]